MLTTILVLVLIDSSVMGAIRLCRAILDLYLDIVLAQTDYYAIIAFTVNDYNFAHVAVVLFLFFLHNVMK